ncbi:hypothetical protein PTSG_05683 [Salpingoeca rosetta]|uniref:Uncharacterized protein n=1 Tax=Salpingoeca rosetta (strain ATCC 50818 / BSB-021) TaxID=946362 RepID=F2UBX2_SALR5|nr:uncharacterized protein PTSG_05683 [Salpingoeca rosetta]EGD73988.1 hypothetical protein PTSG_05683 [Salpingoeca rosetta]|eukprot:XP_004993551.1 hypothetical protein PTSG_05683 [Salpingoeca rosetta]
MSVGWRGKRLLALMVAFQYFHWFDPSQPYMAAYIKERYGTDSQHLQDEVFAYGVPFFFASAAAMALLYLVAGARLALLVCAAASIGSPMLVLFSASLKGVLLSQLTWTTGFCAIFLVTAVLFTHLPRRAYLIAAGYSSVAMMAASFTSDLIGFGLAMHSKHPTYLFTFYVAIASSTLACLIILFGALSGIIPNSTSSHAFSSANPSPVKALSIQHDDMVSIASASPLLVPSPATDTTDTTRTSPATTSHASSHDGASCTCNAAATAAAADGADNHQPHALHSNAFLHSDTAYINCTLQAHHALQRDHGGGQHSRSCVLSAAAATLTTTAAASSSSSCTTTAAAATSTTPPTASYSSSSGVSTVSSARTTRIFLRALKHPRLLLWLCSYAVLRAVHTVVITLWALLVLDYDRHNIKFNGLVGATTYGVASAVVLSLQYVDSVHAAVQRLRSHASFPFAACMLLAAGLTLVALSYCRSIITIGACLAVYHIITESFLVIAASFMGKYLQHVFVVSTAPEAARARAPTCTQHTTVPAATATATASAAASRVADYDSISSKPARTPTTASMAAGTRVRVAAGTPAVLADTAPTAPTTTAAAAAAAAAKRTMLVDAVECHNDTEPCTCPKQQSPTRRNYRVLDGVCASPEQLQPPLPPSSSRPPLLPPPYFPVAVEAGRGGGGACMHTRYPRGHVHGDDHPTHHPNGSGDDGGDDDEDDLAANDSAPDEELAQSIIHRSDHASRVHHSLYLLLMTTRFSLSLVVQTALQLVIWPRWGTVHNVFALDLDLPHQIFAYGGVLLAAGGVLAIVSAFALCTHARKRRQQWQRQRHSHHISCDERTALLR